MIRAFISWSVVHGRLQHEILGIVIERFGLEPGGPAEPARFSDLRNWNLFSGQNQLDIPGKFLASVVAHPIGEPMERVAGGKQPLIFCQAHWSHAQAKMHLASPDTEAHDESCPYRSGVRGIS